jgi:hypothetical protein
VTLAVDGSKHSNVLNGVAMLKTNIKQAIKHTNNET